MMISLKEHHFLAINLNAGLYAGFLRGDQFIAEACRTETVFFRDTHSP
jgi:hypothetical protein